MLPLDVELPGPPPGMRSAIRVRLTLHTSRGDLTIRQPLDLREENTLGVLEVEALMRESITANQAHGVPAIDLAVSRAQYEALLRTAERRASRPTESPDMEADTGARGGGSGDRQDSASLRAAPMSSDRLAEIEQRYDTLSDYDDDTAHEDIGWLVKEIKWRRHAFNTLQSRIEAAITAHESLRARVEQYKAERDSWYAANQTNEAYIADLRQEVEQLRDENDKLRQSAPPRPRAGLHTRPDADSAPARLNGESVEEETG